MAAIVDQLKEEAATNVMSPTNAVDEKNAVKSETKEKGKFVKEENETEVFPTTEIEAKTGVSFPTKLHDGKQLNSVGLRKKSFLGLSLKVYAFGIYADNVKLKEEMSSKFEKAPERPTKEMYENIIDSDVGMTVRMVLVFGGITTAMIKKYFNDTLGASVRKLSGGQNNHELLNKVMGGAAIDSIKLTRGSVIEISRLPGFVLQTKMKNEIVGEVKSELICRAYFHLYFGDDTFDEEAKERFGMSLLSLF